VDQAVAGQLIWYKDQTLKNFRLEAVTIELEAPKKKMEESEEGDSVRACPGTIRQARGEESGRRAERGDL
jgi:hypothetical protein